jgi:hypothetical protein
MFIAIFTPKRRALLVFCLVLLRGVTWGQVQPYDIIISEFMADPSPSLGYIPDAEFIELHNRGKKPVPLSGFKIINGKDTTIIDTAYTLQPNQYVILYQKSDTSFRKFNSRIPVAKLGKLNNPADEFYLVAPNGTTIDAAKYDLTLYQNSKKTGGGWTLERTNVDSPCNPLGWKASENPNGGTPGMPNSVFPKDKSLLEVDRHYFKGSDSLIIVFNKSLSRKSANQNTHYKLSNGLGIAGIDTLRPLFQQVQLKLDRALKTDSIYSLLIKNTLTDCSDSLSFAKKDTTLILKLPQKIDKDSLIINEILVNPVTGGSRFIEIFNNSTKVLDIIDLKIGMKTPDIKVGINMLLFPKEYIVLTENPFNIQEHYKAASFRKRIIKNKLPVWSDLEGSVSLSHTYRGHTDTLDRFTYNKSWHNALLANTEGVSLERVNPNNKSTDSTNWQSAAQTAGYATPAQPNSQLDTLRKVTTNQVFVLERKVFSPDMDGFEDYLNIDYHFDKSGYLATIRIFDDKGKWVKTLIDNASMGLNGQIQWDGDTDEGLKIRTGIYILAIEWVHPKGQVQRAKLPCVVTGRL